RRCGNPGLRRRGRWAHPWAFPKAKRNPGKVRSKRRDPPIQFQNLRRS
ncbi:SPATA33 isoform 7, partial [Pan troglodytes]